MSLSARLTKDTVLQCCQGLPFAVLVWTGLQGIAHLFFNKVMLFHFHCCCDACRAYKGYEEVRVPAMRNKLPDEALVQIADMEEWAQLAFDGYK